MQGFLHKNLSELEAQHFVPILHFSTGWSTVNDPARCAKGSGFKTWVGSPRLFKTDIPWKKLSNHMQSKASQFPCPSFLCWQKTLDIPE